MRTKASGESTLLLLDAIHILRGANIDYAVVGAMAAAVVDARSALEAAPGPPDRELLERLASRYGPETTRSLQSLISRGLDSGLDLD